MKNKKNSESVVPASRRAMTAKMVRGSSECLYIDSWSSLAEYLRNSPNLIREIFIPQKDAAKVRALIDSRGLDGDLRVSDSEKFSVSVEVLWETEDDFLLSSVARDQELIVVCDHITDTRNLGAIARSAAFFGVRHLILPKDRQAPITSATLSSAQGAFSVIKPVEVTNLSRFLKRIKDLGFWIAAADMDGTPLNALPHKYEKLALLLGSEDKGVSRSLLSNADFLISIPAPSLALDSLNVSVASGILLHELTRHK